MNLRSLWLGSGDYAGAAEVLEKANLIYKKRPEIMIVLGQIYASDAGTATDPAARTGGIPTGRSSD